MTMHFPISVFEDWQARLVEFRQKRLARPFVTLSFAQSLDGCLAQHCGQPTRLSDKESWNITHRLRSLHDGILIGRGTLLSDDPLLNVRFYDGPSPRPIVLDTHGESPEDARLFRLQAGRAILATACQKNSALLQRFPGVKTLHLTSKNNRIELQSLLHALHEEGIESLMVEGGGQVLSSFLGEGLCDFLVVTVTPHIIGNEGSVRYKLSTEQSFHFVSPNFAKNGQDLWVWGELRSDAAGAAENIEVCRERNTPWPSVSRS
jgi:3,4-dihydroxy 2-butanone 4-phosphate synthase/GTP cyclohydrolase II